MAAGVEVRDDVVKARLDRLLQLINEVDGMKSSLESVRDQQVPAWPQIPSVQAFASRLQQSIDGCTAEADLIRGTIDDFRLALTASVRSLNDLDQDVQDKMQQIAARLGPVDQTPAPTTTPSSGRRDLASPTGGPTTAPPPHAE